MEKLFSISEAAERCGVHVDTLRRWEQYGYITPHQTKGGHRRYNLKELETMFAKPTKIQVGLFHRESNKMVVSHFVRIPNEGDILRFNDSFFKVEKVLHFYTQNRPKHELSPEGLPLPIFREIGDESDHPNCFEPQIFLVDASEEEIERYDMGSKHDWDRDDWLGHFGEE